MRRNGIFEVAENDSTTGNLKAALKQGAALLRGDPARAESQAQEILKAIPGDPNGLLMLARARRLQGNLEGALACLDQCLQRRPEYAQAHLERGLTLGSIGRGPEAVAALRETVALNPDLPRAWNALSELLALQGDDEGSREAFHRHLAITARHPDLMQTARHLAAGEMARAEQLCRDYLKRHPTDVSAMRLLADIGVRLDQYPDAEALLERCLELASNYHMARRLYAFVLYKRLKYERALHELDRILAEDPGNPNDELLRAAVLGQVGEFDEAIEIYERVLRQYPRQAKAQMSYGHALKTVGRQTDGIAAYRTAIELEPGLGEAYFSLANLKTFTFDDAEVRVMRDRVESSGLDAEDHVHLCFALGAALERRGEHEAAFDYYQKGNAAKRKTVRWGAARFHDDCERLKSFFTAQWLAERGPTGVEDPDPIFVVGLPRAGSTLLEQILASHSQIEGTKELPELISIARRLNARKRRADPPLYPAALGSMTNARLLALGREYLERTRVQRNTEPFFVDKMPNNFSHVGLIHLILPNARIIDARRHPLACCFSGYTQLFAAGQTFSYDLEELGRYYRDYVELMDHWDTVLPGRVLRVQYEDVVTDPEVQVRRLLEFCNLPFEAACLKFYETQRSIPTASSEQVRQPLYRDGLDRWRNYDAFLDPLKDALGHALEAYR